MKFIKLLNKVIFNASISFAEAIIYVFSHIYEYMNIWIYELNAKVEGAD